MKPRLVLALFLLLGFSALYGQQKPCMDYLFLKNGSVFRGEIKEYNPGEQVHIETWNGLQLYFPEKSIRKIRQECPKNPTEKTLPKTYNFKETGFYHATRMSFMLGYSIDNYPTLGIQIKHSSGYAFQRYLGAGLGVGAANYAPFEGTPGFFPIFGEIRGYLLPARVSPFYALSVGVSAAGNHGSSLWSSNETWKGGLMGQLELGYRIGNHFTIHSGWSLQKARRDWRSNWDSSRGSDKFLFQRVELGFGILL